MAQSSAFTEGGTFTLESRITFATLHFFATAADKHSLVIPGMPSTKGAQRTRSTRIKVEKRSLKRHVATLKRRLNRHTRKKVVEAPSSTLVVVVDRQLTFVLNLLEDDSSHGSTGVNSDAEEVPKRAYFMSMPHQRKTTGETRRPAIKRKSTNESAKRAS